MSADAMDLLSRMLTLDPDQRITLEAVWAHPWVARAPRWDPPGVGGGRLYRMLTDTTSGSILPGEAGAWPQDVDVVVSSYAPWVGGGKGKALGGRLGCFA